MKIKNLFLIFDQRKHEYLFWGIIISIGITIGIRLLPTLLYSELWSDEITWYKRSFNLDASLISLRGPIYMFLNNIISMNIITDFSEYKVRLLSIVAGILFMPLYALIIHRLFKSSVVTVSCIILSGFNLSLVSYTHELKPYALVLLLHTMWFFSICCMKNKERLYIYSTLLLIFCSYTSYNMALLYPIHFIIGMVWYLRNTTKFIDILCSSLILLLSGVTLLYIKLNYLNVSTEYWGGKYGVFYSVEFGTYPSWFFERLSSYFSFALNWYTNNALIGGRSNFHFYENKYLGVFIFLAVVITVLRKKSYFYNIAFIVFLTYCVAGILRIWPFGFFRTNLFFFIYASILLIGIFPRKNRDWILATIAIICLFISIRNDFWVKGFKKDIHAKQYIEYICKNVSTNDFVITGHNMARPFHFYLKNYNNRDQGTCGIIKDNIKRGMNIKQIEQEIKNIQLINKNRSYSIWFIAQGTSQMRDNSKTIEHFVTQHDFQVVKETKTDFLLELKKQSI